MTKEEFIEAKKMWNELTKKEKRAFKQICFLSCLIALCSAFLLIRLLVLFLKATNYLLNL